MSMMNVPGMQDKTQMARLEREAFEAFSRVLLARLKGGAGFAEIEAAGLLFGNELCREHQRCELERRASQWADAELMIDSELYRYHAVGSAIYHGLCGSFRIARPTYRKVGMHNGPSVVPLDLDADLLTGATPALAFKLCEGYAQCPSRQVHKALKSSHREPPSRSTTERIAKTLGREIRGQLARLEPIVRAKETVPAGTHSIALGLDRTSAPMQEPLLGVSAGHPKAKRQAPYVRAAPEPIVVNYRMAYVGTVSMLDIDGRALVTRRYGASAEQGSDDIVKRMMNDVQHGRRFDATLPITLVQDGAREMWTTMSAALATTLDPDGLGWHEVIDRHHVLERLADALSYTEEPADFRAKQLRAYNQRLDEDNDAIETIEADLMLVRNQLQGASREKLDAHLTYLNNNKHRMRYATLRQNGLPVGSGPTEGACKSLVMIRAKGCGQRWLIEGLDAVLTLRALDMSERLAPVFDLFRNDKHPSIRLAA